MLGGWLKFAATSPLGFPVTALVSEECGAIRLLDHRGCLDVTADSNRLGTIASAITIEDSPDPTEPQPPREPGLRHRTRPGIPTGWPVPAGSLPSTRPTWKLQATYTLDYPQEDVWNALMDPEFVAKVIPGCDSLTPKDDPDTFASDLRIKIGPIRGKFKADVVRHGVEPMDRFVLDVSAKGPTGFMGGSGRIELEPDSAPVRCCGMPAPSTSAGALPASDSVWSPPPPRPSSTAAWTDSGMNWMQPCGRESEPNEGKRPPMGSVPSVCTPHACIDRPKHQVAVGR